MHSTRSRHPFFRLSLILGTAALSLGLGGAAAAQTLQWDGAANFSGVIFRPGDVAIGVTGAPSPADRLVVQTSSGNGGLTLKSTSTSILPQLTISNPSQTWRFRLNSLGQFVFTDATNSIVPFKIEPNAGANDRLVINNTGINVEGTTTTDVLVITGGADLAEPFEVSSPEPVLPGLVLSVDPEKPGSLRPAGEAYDRKVVGVVSGAGGISPGMLMGMGADRAAAEGKVPVAMTGRVYVRADTSHGPIQIGDLITTSGRPGIAARVDDYGRAHGATLGKAMSALPNGEGLVLVLVSLQ